MPGAAPDSPEKHASTLGRLSGSWTVRAKKAERNGERSAIHLPSGERYTGSWSNNKQEGKGCLVYPNGDKYEGSWEGGKRHGMGILWLYKNGRHRVRYSGEWAHDRFHGRGLHYNDIGNVYEGQWQEGMRHGEGQQLYGGRLPDHFGPDVYNGQWENDNRSGKGKMTYGNGDVYEGEWANDMKNGHGVHYYTTRRKVYEGTWQEDVAKCGTYSELDPAADSHMPALKLQNAQEVLRSAEEELPKLVYY